MIQQELFDCIWIARQGVLAKAPHFTIKLFLLEKTMPWFRLSVLHMRDNGKIRAQKAQMTQDLKESGGKRLVEVPQ